MPITAITPFKFVLTKFINYLQSPSPGDGDRHEQISATILEWENEVKIKDLPITIQAFTSMEAPTSLPMLISIKNIGDNRIFHCPIPGAGIYELEKAISSFGMSSMFSFLCLEFAGQPILPSEQFISTCNIIASPLKQKCSTTDNLLKLLRFLNDLLTLSLDKATRDSIVTSLDLLTIIKNSLESEDTLDLLKLLRFLNDLSTLSLDKATRDSIITSLDLSTIIKNSLESEDTLEETSEEALKQRASRVGLLVECLTYLPEDHAEYQTGLSLITNQVHTLSHLSPADIKKLLQTLKKKPVLLAILPFMDLLGHLSPLEPQLPGFSTPAVFINLNNQGGRKRLALLELRSTFIQALLYAIKHTQNPSLLIDKLLAFRQNPENKNYLFHSEIISFLANVKDKIAPEKLETIKDWFINSIFLTTEESLTSLPLSLKTFSDNTVAHIINELQLGQRFLEAVILAANNNVKSADLSSVIKRLEKVVQSVGIKIGENGSPEEFSLFFQGIKNILLKNSTLLHML